MLCSDFVHYSHVDLIRARKIHKSLVNSPHSHQRSAYDLVVYSNILLFSESDIYRQFPFNI